jgi:hypothetical protein
MQQKFIITRDDAKNRLNIREYAVIDKNPKRAAVPVAKKADFSFLCEESYESQMIEHSIAKGVDTLIAALRTHNIFPIEPNATKIAESVMALYGSAGDGPVELFFDDIELISHPEQ